MGPSSTVCDVMFSDDVLLGDLTYSACKRHAGKD